MTLLSDVRTFLSVHSPLTILQIVGLCFALFLVLDIVQYMTARSTIFRTNVHPSVVKLPQLWSLGPLDIFKYQHTYLYNLSRKLSSAWLKFSIGKKEVSVLLGKEGRQAFYSTKGFSFVHGYSLFHPGLFFVTPQPTTSAWFVHHFMRTDILERLLPKIFNDIHEEVKKLGDAGVIDPIADVQKLVLKVNLRVVLGDAIADDAQKLASTYRAYTLATSDEGGWALLWPLLPTKARINRAIGGAKLWRLISDGYEDCFRLKSSACIPQILRDERINSTEAVKCLFVTIFAGQGNTSSLIRWFFILLCQHPIWQDRIRDEVNAFMRAHIPSEMSMAEALSGLPFVEWEQSLPTLDRCLRETLRLTFNGTNARQNLGPDMNVGGRTIRHGEYVLYMTADAHFDSELYLDPQAFDPDRYHIKAADKSFLAWGAGKRHHPCAGQRLAKMIVKVATVLFIHSFTLFLEGPRGEKLDNIPKPVIGFTDIGKPPSDVVLRYRNNVTAA